MSVRTVTRPLVAAWIAVCALAGCSHGGHPGTHGLLAEGAPIPPAPCAADGAVVIRGIRADDVALACDGARRATGFLAAHGLTAHGTLAIDIVERLPPPLPATAVGCYERPPHRVTVLGLEAFAARREWFRVPVDRELYRSVLAHEVAHAVLGCQSNAERLGTAAHEYVAYVTMFATMAPELRERALAQYPGSGFDSETQINSIVYAFDPERFGVEAWRHFRRLRDPAGFLREVVAGRLLDGARMFGD